MFSECNVLNISSIQIGRFSASFLAGIITDNLFQILSLSHKQSTNEEFNKAESCLKNDDNLEQSNYERDIKRNFSKIVQEKLFGYQKLKNKSLENKFIDVLVENEIKGQNKLFGRNVYMNSVIFEGSKSLIGKVVQVRVVKTNQNTLIGEFSNKYKFKAA